MSSTTETHRVIGDDLYVFVVNPVGRLYTVVFRQSSGQVGYGVRYVLMPREGWGIDEFQATMEARDSAFKYIRGSTEKEIGPHCMSLSQIVPEPYWDEVDVDLDVVTDVRSTYAEQLSA